MKSVWIYYNNEITELKFDKYYFRNVYKHVHHIWKKLGYLTAKYSSTGSLGTIIF